MIHKSYTHHFTCIYDLRMYPLDIQKCQMVIRLTTQMKEFFKLVPNTVSLKGSNFSNQYIIQPPTLQLNLEKEVVVTIILQRQIIYIILTTILPAILINLVSCAIWNKQCVVFKVKKLIYYSFVITRCALLQTTSLKDILRQLLQ